jgi:succinate-semialdehyde dehydrogenase / glutarate-semialdehyde dehydrogenase
VQEAIYDRFTRTFGEKAKQIKVGDGLDPEIQMGPVANDRRLAAMETLIADAKRKGARVVAGGSRIGNRGYFRELTVLADVPDDARAMNEEPFGPLALLSPVKTIDEAIEKANSLPYGLAAYAFTRSARNVDQLAERVEVGNLSINHLTASFAETPFGGVKDSGYGREAAKGSNATRSPRTSRTSCCDARHERPRGIDGQGHGRRSADRRTATNHLGGDAGRRGCASGSVHSGRQDA